MNGTNRVYNTGIALVVVFLSARRNFPWRSFVDDTTPVRSISPPVSTGTIFVGVPLCQERNDPKKTWACPTASLFYSRESAMGEVCTRNDPNTRISSEQYNNNKCNYYYYYDDDDDGYGTATTIRLGGGPQQRHFTTTIIAATDGIHTTTTTIHHSY